MTSVASPPTLAVIARSPSSSSQRPSACASTPPPSSCSRACSTSTCSRGSPAAPATLAWLADELAELATPVSLQMTVELACAFGLLVLRDQRLELTTVTRPVPARGRAGAPARARRPPPALPRGDRRACPAALREIAPPTAACGPTQADAREQAAYFQARGALQRGQPPLLRLREPRSARAHVRARPPCAPRRVRRRGRPGRLRRDLLKQAAPRLHGPRRRGQLQGSATTSPPPPRDSADAGRPRRAARAQRPARAARPDDRPAHRQPRVLRPLARRRRRLGARACSPRSRPAAPSRWSTSSLTGAPAHDQRPRRAPLRLVDGVEPPRAHAATRPTDPRDDRRAWGWNSPWRCDELAAPARAGRLPRRPRAQRRPAVRPASRRRRP